MANVVDRLAQIEQRIMSGLKDFQQATVNRIDHLYRNGRKRILVSDEVGLGKTLSTILVQEAEQLLKTI